MSTPSRARLTATDRVKRLLVIVPWIASRDGPSVAEVCERFGLGRQELLADLAIVPFVGLPPYTPDALLDVTVEDDRVWVRFAEPFRRPLRLTPEQGLSLLAAGASAATIRGADPQGPLARGLAKLGAVLGVEPGQAVSVDLGSLPRDVVDPLREAIAAGRRVRIDYYTYGRDERTLRDIDPSRVFSRNGAWYLLGWCHLAQGERLFRIDRIGGVEVLDEKFERQVGDDLPELFNPAPDAVRVVLEVAPEASWVADHYPVEAVEPGEDGWLRLRLAVTALPWLERLLLRLGPMARVLSSDDPTYLRAQGDAASRVLKRYS